MHTKRFLTVFLLIFILSTASALAGSCNLCANTGYVALKAANSSDYVAVPCPECAASPAGGSGRTESPAQAAASQYFPNYTVLQPGESVNVRGVGRYVLNDIHLGEEVHQGFTSLNVWLEGHFENTSNQNLLYKNLFSNVKLHYINEDNKYSFDAWTFGEYNRARNTYFSMSVKEHYRATILYNANNSNAFNYASIDPLEDHDFMIGFNDLPDRVVSDRSGTVAVTLQFKGSSEKYVFFARR